MPPASIAGFGRQLVWPRKTVNGFNRSRESHRSSANVPVIVAFDVT